MHARPHSLEQALELLGHGRWSVLAGGTDFYPGLRDRAPAVSVVDITSIDALNQIDIDNTAGVVRIGALTTWSALVATELPAAFDALKAAAIEVGSIQIQNRATIAGNLCNASPAADGVPPLLCLDAEVELTSVNACRRVPLSEFIQGNRKTVRNSDELVTAILVPTRVSEARVSEGRVSEACVSGASAFQKLGARRYLVISISMVAANITLDAAGTIERVAVAVGSCSEVAKRLSSLEQYLVGQPATDFSGAAVSAALADQIETAVLADLSPIDDVRATGSYRYRAAAELIYRTLAQAVNSIQESDH